MTPPDYDIRYSNLDDISFLREWFSTPHACDNFPFSIDEKEDFLKNWIGFSKFKASLTGMMKDVPCAVGTLFLMPYRKVAHHCSFQLVVEPQHRRKGIGTSMVRNLLHLAKTRFRLESVHVEIFEPCSFLSILEKLEFKPFARQEKFVKMEDGSYRARILLEHFEPVAKPQFGPKSALALPDSDLSQIAYTDSHMVDLRKTEPALRSSNLDRKASFATGSMSQVTIRFSEEKEQKYLVEWLLQPGVLEGFPLFDLREVEDAARISLSYAKEKAALTSLYNGEPCGIANLYIQPYKKLAHQCLFMIIVDEKYRGKGIGSKLLQELIALAKDRFKIELLHLEVYEGNPAIRLYERFGFQEYGRQQHFMKDQGHYIAKILMQKAL